MEIKDTSIMDKKDFRFFEILIGFSSIIISLSAFKDELNESTIYLFERYFSYSECLITIIGMLLFALYLYSLEYVLEFFAKNTLIKDVLKYSALIVFSMAVASPIFIIIISLISNNISANQTFIVVGLIAVLFVMIVLFAIALIKLIQSINNKKYLTKFKETAYLFDFAYEDYRNSNFKSYISNIFAALKSYGFIRSKVKFNYDLMYETDGIDFLTKYEGVVQEDINEIIKLKEIDSPNKNDANSITNIAKVILEKSNYLGHHYFELWMRAFFRRIIKEKMERDSF